MKKIIIIGAGDGGRLISELVGEQKGYKIIGFIDDNGSLQNKIINGYQVVGASADLHKFKGSGFIISLGMNMAARNALYRKAISTALEPVNLIHNTAVISRSAKILKGAIILANCVIGPFVKLGENNFMFTGTIIEHDSYTGNNVYFAPGVSLAGHVKVGDNTFFGVNSCVTASIRIGSNVVVGAGSCVLEDVADNITVAGVPAKVLRRNNA